MLPVFWEGTGIWRTVHETPSDVNRMRLKIDSDVVDRRRFNFTPLSENVSWSKADQKRTYQGFD